MKKVVSINAALLNNLRTTNKISQNELAELVSCAPSTISKAENGHNIHRKTAEKIACILNVPEDKFITKRHKRTVKKVAAPSNITTPSTGKFTLSINGKHTKSFNSIQGLADHVAYIQDLVNAIR